MSETAVLTAFDLQGAVLLVQRVAAQVHHAGCGCGDPTTQSGMENIYKIHQRAGARQPQAAPFISFDLQYRVRCARQSRMMTNICNSGAADMESPQVKK